MTELATPLPGLLLSLLGTTMQVENESYDTDSGTTIALCRVYDAVHQPLQRGHVFLIDRLWPRGVRKADLRFDSWLKEVAPSKELRTWFGHDPQRWESFANHYRAELDTRPDELDPILNALRSGPVTFLYASKDTEYNHAIVLRDYIRELFSMR